MQRVGIPEICITRHMHMHDQPCTNKVQPLRECICKDSCNAPEYNHAHSISIRQYFASMIWIYGYAFSQPDMASPHQPSDHAQEPQPAHSACMPMRAGKRFYLQTCRYHSDPSVRSSSQVEFQWSATDPLMRET